MSLLRRTTIKEGSIACRNSELTRATEVKLFTEKSNRQERVPEDLPKTRISGKITTLLLIGRDAGFWIRRVVPVWHLKASMKMRMLEGKALINRKKTTK